MKIVYKKLEELYYKTDRCVRCGRCTTVCPTYNVTKRESMLARGRVRLVREYVEGKLELGSILKLYNNLCLGCNACSDVCPVHIPVAELVGAMKEEVIRTEGMTLTDSLLVKQVLSSPQSFRRVIHLLSVNRRLGTTKLLPGILKNKEKILPEIPTKSFRDLYSSAKGQSEAPKKKFKVGYFVGCLTNALYPSMVFDIIKVLENHDCEVIIPKETVCCGLPQQASGAYQKALSLAKTNMQAFMKEQVDYIVTDCGTCGHALKDYHDYLWESDQGKTEAQDFSGRVHDINEFLVDVAGLRVGTNPIKARVTYHDSCHLNRNQKVTRQPRELLKSISGLEFVEMPEANWCCGAAGSYSFKHTDLSLKILKRKIENTESTGAQYVTAGCPACIMQIDYGKREFSQSYQVLHPVQLLAKTF